MPQKYEHTLTIPTDDVNKVLLNLQKFVNGFHIKSQGPEDNGFRTVVIEADSCISHNFVVRYANYNSKVEVVSEPHIWYPHNKGRKWPAGSRAKRSKKTDHAGWEIYNRDFFDPEGPSRGDTDKAAKKAKMEEYKKHIPDHPPVTMTNDWEVA